MGPMAQVGAGGVEYLLTDALSACLLCSVTQADRQVVNWIDAPRANIFVQNLYALGEKLLLIP